MNSRLMKFCLLIVVAKIVGDHGGIIECESQPRRTVFRVLFPMYAGKDAAAEDIDDVAMEEPISSDGKGVREPAVDKHADASLQPRQRTMKGGRPS